MAVVRKKQDDKILKTLRELVGIGGNKQCFDCGQKGPTYINMTIGSFVCTTCSGILRGLTPPHRVKSISMATFTQEEIDFVRQNGNDACSRTWLGLWDPKRAIKQEHRDFMIDKYERKRYYLEPASPLKSLSTNTSSSTSSLPSSNGFSSSSSNISSRNGTENVVPLKTVTLTPPSTLRLCRTNSTSSNVLNGNGSHLPSVTSSSTSLKFQQQFSPDDSNFFSEPPKILPPTPQKHSNNHHQRLNGTVNGANFERNQRNGLLTSTSNGNKFTPDSDFVADFSNANIVNVNGSANGSSGLKNNNNNKLSNGFNEKGNLCNGHQNGNGEQSNSDMENFADFEHNTIYNAAGVPISASSKSATASISTAPSVDRYAALKDLDDQLREIKLECETNNNNIVNGTSNSIMNGNHTNDVHQTSTANPFKSANPFQQPQQHQQHQQQQQSLNWTIPGSTSSTGTTTNGFYGTSPYQNGFTHANYINGNAPNGIGFSNSFHQPSSNAYGSAGIGSQVAPQFNSAAVGSVHQPLNHFGHFGNPFVTAGATTAVSNSNNPFL
ncbi:arf-GAP domain and FG repeat-containing protein 1 isoform X3 [Malaya genurostris]|uniref:arf-GAP domain and FG repeat-containing protein 1 isoform X3 n=1 Tax=Malaya genurostris TaxID=325434 RepID=UPI0026F3FBC1|nr:arf-GAP domain and FG repeat-containing protein 1 isoform X3 [Malaya genurostris]